MARNQLAIYSAFIAEAITKLMQDNPLFDSRTLSQDNNATHFIHALANIVPAQVYKILTGKEVDILEFNHIANRLVMQFGHPVDPVEENG